MRLYQSQSPLAPVMIRQRRPVDEKSNNCLRGVSYGCFWSQLLDALL